jgi:hypothetical protein
MENQSLSQHMFIHYLLAALSFAVVYFWFNSLPLALLALSINIFLDADHVFDFWLGSGFSLNPQKFIKETLNGSPYFERSGKTLIPFHSWELLALFFIVTTVLNTSQVYLTFVVGFVPHLLWDQMTFAKNPWMYFFTYRLMKGFDYTQFCHG